MKTALVISDDPQPRSTLRQTLEGAGYHVITVAAHPIETNELPLLSPALVVLDVGLPTTLDRDLCREIRCECRDVPLLVLCDVIDAANTVLFLNLGADGYMTKSLDPTEFLARVRAITAPFQTSVWITE